jgi:hypothetical protein
VPKRHSQLFSAMVSIVENGRYLLLNDEVYSQRVERRSLRNQRSHLLIFYTEISYLNLLQIGIKIRTANMFFSGPKFHECKMLWSLTNSGSRAPLKVSGSHGRDLVHDE